MRNPICNHCRYKRFTCPLFRCDPYYEAQYKKAERRFVKAFLEDFNGEDRYYAGLFVGWSIAIVVITLMFYSLIKIIGEWMR